MFHTLAFTQIPVWATSGPWLSTPIGRFPCKKDVLVPSAGGGVGNQHDTTQLARELHKGIRIWKRRWCNGISEQVDRTGKSIRPLDIWQLKTIVPNQDLAVGHHSSPSTQQQHLWACGGTSRYETKWSTCGRGNNFARIFTQFDWCSFWTRSCVSFTMLFLAMQIDCKRWQKTEKHGSQQIHNVVLNYPGHAYRRQQQQNKLNSDDFWLVVSFRENCNIWLWNHETTRCKWCNRTTPNCAAGKGAPLVCEHDLPSAVRICYVLMDQDLL